MRVLHLTTEFPPIIYGGLGTAVGGWVTASARAGMTMGVLLVGGELVTEGPGGARSYGAVRAPSGQQTVNFEEAVLDHRGIHFYRTAPTDAVDAGLRLVQSWEPDIVHLHTAMIWPVAQAIQHQTSTPVVYHVHSVDRAEYEIGEEPHPWLAHSPQEEAILSADRLIALSGDERNLLAAYYPDTEERIRVVGNGIEEPTIGGRPRPRSRHAPVVLYSGRLVERKGIRDLLAAIPTVLRAAPDTQFVLAGGPPPLSGTEVADQWLNPELEPYRSQIHFTGWLSPSEVEDWYRKADIQVVPSRYEPFGMVILEGMIHGLPIVASDVGGPAEILEHGRTALLFPPWDVEALSHALIALVRDGALRQRLGREAMREVRRNWTWPNLVQRMRQVYEELAPARAKGSLEAAGADPCRKAA